MTERKRLIAAVVLLFCALGMNAQQSGPEPVRYNISLADAADQVLHVRISLPTAADSLTLQLPVWNALYQVRDFAQYVTNVTATDSHGQTVAVIQRDKSSWTMPEGANGATVEYNIAATVSGPYGAESNANHVFLNLAEVLMYVAGSEHTRPVSVELSNVPQDWSVATVLRADGMQARTWVAPNYDLLVDAPLEIGKFREIKFQDGSTKYQVVIDAEPADYDARAIENSLQRIVHTETEWMNDQPCAEYLFIYHFPHEGGGGGMEHRCSTAIDVPAERMTEGMTAFEGVTAHEFFHQWNVKRIRPQSLEPVDYTKEQYTRALWFSEGVTSTVEDYMLLGAGLLTGEEYLRRLSNEIDVLQNRPANRTQSVEESSLDAWLEKYPYYRRPERSISYYNKGEIVGVMLDLAIRDASGGVKSLRDVFQWMNANYAQKGKYFADSKGVRAAVEAVTGKDFSRFFRQYIASTSEVPYNEFLKTAGLRLVENRRLAAEGGFAVARNFDGLPVVVSVQPGSEAERAGVKQGDIIVAINDKPNATLGDELAVMSPGDMLKVLVRSRGKEREVELKLSGREVSQFNIVAVERPTPAQLSRRAQWLDMPSKAAVAAHDRGTHQ